ncbi:MAG: redoxin family protein [Rhodospirillales bacterium]|nr:redoxin family protein [Rhodospirillales bacterium]MCB9996233.1 redoxin family protein [Rhodospirillales bacterium]
MKLNVLIFIGTVVFGFLITYMLQRPCDCKGTPVETAANPLEVTGKDLPVFSMTDMHGTTFQSTNFAGKTIIINFWASWCPPCVAEFPRLLELAKRHPDTLVLLAVSSDHNREAMMRFLNKMNADESAVLKQDNVHIIEDADNSITFNIFQTLRLPETVIVSPEQKMLHKFIGIDWTVEDVEAYLPAQ